MSPRTRRSATALAVASAALLAACSGGGGDDDNDVDDGGPRATLNTEEAQAVAGTLYIELFDAIDDELIAALGGDGSFARGRDVQGALATRLRATGLRAARLPAGRLRAAALADDDFTVDADCARGGRIRVAYRSTGTLNDEGTGTLNATMTMTPQGCVVSTGSRALAVNGDPSLQWSYGVTLRDWEFVSDWVWRGTGGFRWDGGSCDMDYTMTLTPAGTGRMLGTMCGQRVDETF